ncbi:MAG: DUF4405 domain-containing protein [Candidatus Kuenenia sp.]|nr:DUF4405 domain-containing protein [Candidatus Kuenenia hertensis]
MKRSLQNIIVDAIAFVGFILLTTTGILMHYLLPVGSRRFKTIWGLDRHEWGNIHFWISVVFLCSLTLHLLLHWRWVVNILTGKSHEGSGSRVALGIIGFIGILAFAVSPLLSPVEDKKVKTEECDLCLTQDHEKIQIWGSMTLSEVEKETEVSVEYIIEKLGIPADADRKERLGKLRKEYGFEIEDVRRIICEYKTKR